MKIIKDLIYQIFMKIKFRKRTWKKNQKSEYVAKAQKYFNSLVNSDSLIENI